MREPLHLRVYRRTLRRASPEFRDRFADEMVLSLAAMIGHERERRGWFAAAWLWIRAMSDARRTSTRQRVEAGVVRPHPFTGIGDDLKYVFRSWRRAKAFVATAVVTIGCGLGLNAAIFAFVDGYLFRASPFDDPDRLYAVRARGGAIGLITLDDSEAIVWDQTNGIAGRADWDISHTLAGGGVLLDGRIQIVNAFEVSPGFDRIMGFRLEQGRGFTAADHQPSAVLSAWVSHRFWRQQLDGATDVVGRRLKTTVAAIPELEIVGVLPQRIATFDLNNAPPDLVLPAVPKPPVPAAARRNSYDLPMIRLAPGSGPELVTQRLTATIAGVQAREGTSATPRSARLVPVRDLLTRGGRPTATLLLVLSLLMLLLVVVNLGHLLMTRTIALAHENGLRRALGASAWRVVRLRLSESVMLCAAGLLVAWGIGYVASMRIAASVPAYPTQGRNLSLVPMVFDARTMAATALAALVVALMAGFWPALKASRRATLAVTNAPGMAAPRLRVRTVRFVLISEVALATVVLSASLYVGLSAWRLLHQPLGFSADGLYSLSIDLPPTPDRAALATRRQDVLHALTASPFVSAAGVGNPPVWGDRDSLVVDGAKIPGGVVHSAGEGLFDTLRMTMLAGRSFETAEAIADAPVAIVDRALADRLWPGQDPLGRLLTAGGRERQVVGVVGSVRSRLVSANQGAVFIPAGINSAQALSFVFVARRGTPRDVMTAASRAVNSVAPGARIWTEPLTFDVLFMRQAGEQAFHGPIVAVIGIAALVLVAVGLLGVVTVVVEHRLREFGIRLALGARRVDIWRAVVRQSLVPAVAGVVIGSAAALWGHQFLQAQVVHFVPTRLGTLAAVAVTVLILAVAAALRPAARAMRVDPVITLRAE